ncbi:hypothetical protein [Aquimarina sp. 2201CG14-23]|uniref:hypothetical protein n=1 Tax=Aquimarina mycalae TaxID=3040073 RepID=UPI0024781F83|nr:hypothetical protein [Aquimarina sp. 2201CG14-23]MDH7446540.1 hypothetical protein [Aquimarina sp. 2201CG14-23]
MNNGKKYKIVLKKLNTEVNDPNIIMYRKIGDNVLKLNRVLIIQGNNELTELIEYKKEAYTFYESREFYTINSDKKLKTIMKTISEN